MFQPWTPTRWFYQVTNVIKMRLLNVVAFLFAYMRQIMVKHWLRSIEGQSSFAANPNPNIFERSYTFFDPTPILFHVTWLLCDLLKARSNVWAITAASWRPLVDRCFNPAKSKLSEQIRREMLLILRVLGSALLGFLIGNVVFFEEKPVWKM